MSTYLPGLLGQIADIIGEGNALAIARAKGGGRCSFPAEPARDHWLSVLVGHDKARKLCKEFAVGSADSDRLKGVYLEIPLGPISSRAELHRTIDKLAREGKSQDAIARACGVSRRTVQRRLGDRMSGDPERRQSDLFDLPKSA